ncbi:PIG-L deacetylase family protein [Enterovirga sp. CN4-39]|uniref:PIG-L deacetylase family protein n=1 Tax=Enterovirga sp. CN4-39 TaxID=3400910 RepID=UPI003C0D35E8
MDAASILARITGPTRPRIPGRTVLVFAHPDDETLACGALLPRLEDVTIVHVTDGAPRNGEDARRRGFATPADYAAARRNELRAAMALAGVPGDRVTCLGVPDQGAAFALAEIARRLVPILDGADVAVTHAYEGGHPDHDAVCWAVHGALGLVSAPRPALVEAPLYRLGPDGGWLRQTFAEEEGVAILRVTEAERELKRGMVAAHASQSRTLAHFTVSDEPFRLAPTPDFGSLPNGGALLYEQYGWGLTGGQWLELAADAARALRQERAA